MKKEKILYLGNVKNKVIEGWYLESIHSDIPAEVIKCEEDLYRYLLSLGQAKFKDEAIVDFEKEYTIEDKELFQRCGFKFSNEVNESERSEAELLLKLAKKEIQINEIKNKIDKIEDQLGITL
nr:MAG TPA: hypothetical protein [Caudoviricetes sp.]